MPRNLKGQKAIITGASSGIGKAVTLELISAGVDVALVSRNAKQFLTTITSEISAAQITAQAYDIDLADIANVKPSIQMIAQEFNGIDILINNAGTAYVGEIIDTPLADWQRVIDVNLTSVFQCIQAILPVMRSQHHGVIINVASIAAKQSFPQWGTYSASKFALLGLTQALAAEERSHGIKVMSICPGSVDTAIWDKVNPDMVANFDRKLMLKPETVAEAIMQLLNLPPEAVITDLVLMPNVGTF